MSELIENVEQEDVGLLEHAVVQYLVQMYNDLANAVIGNLKEDERIICLDGDHFEHVMNNIKETTETMGELIGISLYEIPSEAGVEEEVESE